MWLKRGAGEDAERRSGSDRRTGRDRRDRGRRDGRRSTSELYQSDLDRHLWSWASPGAKKRRREKSKRARRRRFAGVVASAAGALSAAGVSYLLYKRLREEELPEEDNDALADLDEADFEDQ
jgi:hypothetical protein